MLSTTEILALRGAKNPVDAWRPYAWLHETEPNCQGCLESYATIFLTNRECPYRCLMCDLWKNTTDNTIPVGAIPAQIEIALGELPATDNVKLYNSGNFFDAQAIPRKDHPTIAHQLAPFRRVVVENHPRMTDQRCVDFQQLIQPQLEIALGLETIHPQILPALNKQMTLSDFSRAVDFLRAAEIDVRAFILLKPPGLDEQQAIHWAVKSIEFAFSQGVHCCSLIPVRAGNGAIDDLVARKLFQEPRMRSLEIALQQAIQLGRGRVFIDLWDAKRFAECKVCSVRRIARLNDMNLTQRVTPEIVCEVCGNG
jgi:radical SAM enzyme (TIGR01210 family)